MQSSIDLLKIIANHKKQMSEINDFSGFLCV